MTGSSSRKRTTSRCARDLSNLPEALERIRDPAETEALAERAWEDLIVSGRYSYGAFAAHVESVVDELAGGRVRSRRRAAASWRALNAASDAYSAVRIRPPRLAYRLATRHAPWVADAMSARAGTPCERRGSRMTEAATVARRQPAFAGVRQHAAAGARAVPAHSAGPDASRRCARRCGCWRPARRAIEIVYWNAGYSVPRAIRRLRVDAIDPRQHAARGRAGRPSSPPAAPTFDWLADVDALKIAFPQDEYNHAHVLDDWLADLGVDVVFSVFGPEHRELLYPRLGARARFEQCLTGYVDELDITRHAAVVLPHDRRELDLAYRAQALTPRFGRLGQLKHTVAEAVARSPRPPACASTSRPTRRDADPRRPLVPLRRLGAGGARQRERRERGRLPRRARGRRAHAAGRASGPHLRRLRRGDARRLGRAAARLGRAAAPGGRRRSHLPGTGRGWLRRRPGAGGALPPGAGGTGPTSRPSSSGWPIANWSRQPRRAPTPTSCSAAATATPRWRRSSSECSTRSGRAGGACAVRGFAAPCAGRGGGLQRRRGASAALGVQGGRPRRPRGHPAPGAGARALVPARTAASPPVIVSARGLGANEA